MLFQSHVLLGVIFFLLVRNWFSGGNEIVFFLLVLLGSVLPDIDSSKSRVNKWSGIFGVIVGFAFRHRGIFHSLLFHLLLFFIVRSFFGVYYASGLFLGYLAHLVGDGISKGGVKVFYPFSSYKVRGFMKVGGFVEGLLFVVMFLLILWQFL